MTHVKAYLLLAVCIGVASAACLLFGWLISASEPAMAGTSPFMLGVVSGLTAGPFFGALYWCMVVPPPVVPPKPTGWRRYRFFMWWAGLTAALSLGMTVRWGVFQWEALVAAAVVALFFALGGWLFAAQRADRARAIAKDKQRMDLAGRSAKAILMIAGSDPDVPLYRLAGFLSKPYTAMNWMGSHVPSQNDLHYFNGVTDTVVVPAAINEDGSTQPLRPEYGLFMSLLRTLVSGEWEEAPTRQVVEHLEEQAVNLRSARLAKKL